MRDACLIYYNPKTLFGGSAEANAALAGCANYDDKLKEIGNFGWARRSCCPTWR